MADEVPGPKATTDSHVSSGPVRRCPLCKKAAQAPHLPFCSKRCADIDLGKWFSNTYAIAGATDDDEDEKSENAGRPDDTGGI
jgi:uncharacterized protein